MSTTIVQCAPELRRILQVAVEAAQAAGAVIREAASASRRSEESFKGHNDVVTETDRRSQQLIELTIKRSFPKHELIGEETHTGPVIQSGSGYRWIIDPVDGTTNFVHRFPPYAVSIGVMRDEQFVVGVVLNVPMDELFTAALGDGAFLDGQPIHVSSTQQLSDALICTGFPERSFEQLDRLLQIQSRVMRSCRGLRRPGAASVDLANTACGRIEGFYEEGLRAWDVAAGAVLIREAGGIVTNFGGGDELFESRSILASNGAVHRELLDCLS